MAAFARCEQEASDIIEARLRDAGFRQRLECSSQTWNMEFQVFIRRVQVIIAIALIGGYGGTDQSPAKAAKTALTVLREHTLVELFGVLPAALEDSASEVEHLRLLSIVLTAQSAIRWERLIQTARSVLDENAEYPGEEDVVQDPGGPDVTYETLSAEH
ncbi:hypothetical protein ACIRJO_32170 [Streptomyces sp. NPDC102394]|uniref:hypothetical protein n=1 Tax=Streptomyces sp. NPDC102394 TaxID=3366167 RepID=UPI003809DCBB